MTQCERCLLTITPRGGSAPRFCPRCGQSLQDVAHAATPVVIHPETSNIAIWSLVLGVIALVMPVVGVVLGFCAVAGSISAFRLIQRSRGRYTGRGLAGAGFVLGAIAIFLHLAICARLM